MTAQALMALEGKPLPLATVPRKKRRRADASGAEGNGGAKAGGGGKSKAGGAKGGGGAAAGGAPGAAGEPGVGAAGGAAATGEQAAEPEGTTAATLAQEAATQQRHREARARAGLGGDPRRP